MLLGWQPLVIVLIQSEQLSSAVVSRVLTSSDSLTYAS
jgi:hypothetical protein